MDFWVVICGVVILMQFLIRWMEMEVVGLVSAHHGEQIVNWNVKWHSDDGNVHEMLDRMMIDAIGLVIGDVQQLLQELQQTFYEVSAD